MGEFVVQDAPVLVDNKNQSIHKNTSLRCSNLSVKACIEERGQKEQEGRSQHMKH